MLSQWVRRAASSTNFVPLLRPPDRKLIRVGSCINWLSVAALPLVAELPLAFLHLSLRATRVEKAADSHQL